MLRYTVLLHRSEEVSGYSVLVLQLPGCFSQGRTVEEALANAKEAIECHLEAMAENGEELPVEGEPYLITSVVVEPPHRQRRSSPDAVESVTFIMHGKRYSLSRDQIIEGAREVGDLSGPNDRTLWYVRVSDRRLPVRRFMRQLLRAGFIDVTLGKSIEVLDKLGFEVIYAKDKKPAWAKLRSA